MDFDQFYCELLHELGKLAREGGTAVGAAVVAKRVALDHGVSLAEWVPLPRLTKEEKERAQWVRRQEGAPAEGQQRDRAQG